MITDLHTDFFNELQLYAIYKITQKVWNTQMSKNRPEKCKKKYNSNINISSYRIQGKKKVISYW